MFWPWEIYKSQNKIYNNLQILFIFEINSDFGFWKTKKVVNKRAIKLNIMTGVTDNKNIIFKENIYFILSYYMIHIINL